MANSSSKLLNASYYSNDIFNSYVSGELTNVHLNPKLPLDPHHLHLRINILKKLEEVSFLSRGGLHEISKLKLFCARFKIFI